MSENSNCDKHTVVHQLVEVDAEVTIKPVVKHGKPKICCVESDIESNTIKSCNCRKCQKSRNKCTYRVTQVICVEIPIEFDVEVDVDEGISKCCTPDLGPCKKRKSVEKDQQCEPDEQQDCCNSAKQTKYNKHR